MNNFLVKNYFKQLLIPGFIYKIYFSFYYLNIDIKLNN